MVGVAEKDQIVDGTTIAAGDSVVAVASNGLHTNGYTLGKALLDAQPDLADAPGMDGESFLDAILRPHKCYYRAVRSSTRRCAARRPYYRRRRAEPSDQRIARPPRCAGRLRGHRRAARV